MMYRSDLRLELETDDIAVSTTSASMSSSGLSVATTPTTNNDDPIDAYSSDFRLALETVRHEVDALTYRVESPSHVRQRDLHIHVYDRRFKYPTWMHPNIGGEAQYLTADSDELAAIAQDRAKRKHNLGEWTATAISGNDILSSVLFTAGLTTARAGKLAPVAQIIVSIVIYCMRFVMEEVMSAVPLNGGCYSALLNGSTKRVAALSSVFCILSYLATGVVCAVSAFNYLSTLVATIPVVASSVGLLFGFAILCLFGIAESAAVALAFFVVHALTLTVLCVTSIVYMAQHPSVLVANMVETALPDTVVMGGSTLLHGDGWTALFFGVGTAMLGVTGFESSAQFVEAQAPGVFPKTLRNMWACASVYNILLSVLALGVVPLADIVANKDVLLAHMGALTAGRWLQVAVAIDAFVVLAGAVLTSYVGIVGLVQRLAVDRILPHKLTRVNTWRGTAHWIIGVYCVAASSLVVITNGAIDGLAGVFAFAFLGVLASFVLACVVLKVTRRAIPRDTTTTWLNCCVCLLLLAVAFIANALADPRSLGLFVLYFGAIGLLAAAMLERVSMLQCVLELTKRFAEWRNAKRFGTNTNGTTRNGTNGDSIIRNGTNGTTHNGALPNHHHHQRQCGPRRESIAITTDTIGSIAIAKAIERIKRTPSIYFCKAPVLPQLNDAIAYVLQNEQTYCLRLVHVVAASDATGVPSAFADIVCLFDHIYPLLKIDFVAVTGTFDAAMVHWLVAHLDVPTNMMFMRQPTTRATHAVAGEGVRVIAA